MVVHYFVEWELWWELSVRLAQFEALVCVHFDQPCLTVSCFLDYLNDFRSAGEESLGLNLLDLPYLLTLR